MRRTQVPLAYLSITLAVLALDMAILRNLTRSVAGSNQTPYLVPIDPTHSMSFCCFALGVLPMASLLIPITIAQAWRIRLMGSSPAPWLGFVMFGWLSMFAFMALGALSPPAVQTYLLGIGGTVGPAILAILGDGQPNWVYNAVESVLGVVAFGLPQILTALLGARLVGRPSRRVSIVNQPPGRRSSFSDFPLGVNDADIAEGVA